MNRKDEIIALQNEILQEKLSRSLKKTGEDLWGRSGGGLTLPDDEGISSAGGRMDEIRRLADENTRRLNELTRQLQNGESIRLPDFPAMPGLSLSGKEENQTKPAESQKTSEKEAASSDDQPAEPEETIEDLKKELNGYIGLDTIKKEVESLINYVTIMQKRKDEGLPTPELSLHMVFSGNPGTGKTMVARLMSRIYKSLGLLSKGHLVETDRSGLVAGYVGQTAIKTQEIVNKALGGVLFIDEAYALTNHGENDYGQEAVDTLLKAMEDHRDDLIVIVAGYIELMEKFVSSNPGLKSRFNRFMHFPDYTLDEMMAIFEMRCTNAGYELADDEAKEALKARITKDSQDVSGFGNARGVRNLFEKSLSCQADRLAKKETLTREDLVRLTREDIESC